MHPVCPEICVDALVFEFFLLVSYRVRVASRFVCFPNSCAW